MVCDEADRLKRIEQLLILLVDRLPIRDIPDEMRIQKRIDVIYPRGVPRKV